MVGELYSFVISGIYAPVLLILEFVPGVVSVETMVQLGMHRL